MLNITLQGLDKSKSVLAALMDARIAQQAANKAAESYVTDTLDWIADGKAFKSHFGGAGLEGGVSWHPQDGGAVVTINDKDFARVDPDTGRHYTANPSHYAGFVEFGTEAHVIAPTGGRKGLTIPVSGGEGFIIRRMVKHPGSRPFPFFFADMDERRRHMGEAVRSLLLDKLRAA